MVLFNPEPEPQAFSFSLGAWRLVLDSSGELPLDSVAGPAASTFTHLNVPARSLLVLRHV